jgi:hypothetical protein
LIGINRVRLRQVTLIFEDSGNPAVQEIEQSLMRTRMKIYLKDGPIQEAIREIATARNLAVAKVPSRKQLSV